MKYFFSSYFVASPGNAQVETHLVAFKQSYFRKDVWLLVYGAVFYW